MTTPTRPTNPYGMSRDTRQGCPATLQCCTVSMAAHASRLQPQNDLAAVLTARRMESIIDDLLAAKRLAIRELSDAVDLVSRRGKPGSALLHEFLAMRSGDPDPTATPLERRGSEAAAHGWRVVRLTWQDLNLRSHDVVNTVRRALER